MTLRFLLFNPLVKLYLNSNFWFLEWNKRVKSVILEMWFSLSIFFPWLIILMIPQMIATDTQRTDIFWLELPSMIMFGGMMIVLINKDFFNGQSAVHRKLGYQVVDAKSGQVASKLKCMLRNVTSPVWPIEAIFIFASPQRRLGDFIAGTKLISVPASDPESLLSEIRGASFDNNARLTLLISVVWIALLTVYFTLSTPF